MSKRRSGSLPLFVAQHGERQRRVLHVCAECGRALTGRKQRWCGKDCVEAYLTRGDPAYARHLVFQRDHGVCAICRLNAQVVELLVGHAIEDAMLDEEFPWARALRVARVTQVKIATLRRFGLARWHKRHSWWDADHVVPVADGGGECGLENLRTLCLRCHLEVTVRWRRQRRARSRGR